LKIDFTPIQPGSLGMMMACERNMEAQNSLKISEIFKKYMNLKNQKIYHVSNLSQKYTMAIVGSGSF
jgi:hypothetical protein